MAEQLCLALVGCDGITGNHRAGYKELMDSGTADFVVTACYDTGVGKAQDAAADIARFQSSPARTAE